MSKILLVIDHLGPDEKAFHYAIQLCQTTRAELDILRINVAESKARQTMKQGIFMPVDPELNQLVDEANKLGVHCSVTVKDCRSNSEIIRYGELHRDIILAIYDRMESVKRSFKKNAEEKRLAGDLRVPVVRVCNERRIHKFKTFNNIFMEVTKMGNAIRKMGSFFRRKRKNRNVDGILAGETRKNSPLTAQSLEKEKARLVVVGNESTFSEEVVTYAIEMAQRMSYRIIALNTAPLSCETFKLFSSSHSQVCQDFESLAKQSAKQFEEKAGQHDIPFTHVVKFVETDEALEEVQTEFGEIGFIVSEPQDQQVNRKPSENENRQSAEICVYSLR